MSYQEKKIITSIISGILILVAYSIYGISKYQELGAILLNDLKFWATAMLIAIGGGIIVTIIIQIIFHILLAIANEVVKEVKKEVSINTSCKVEKETYDELEIADFEDEMDKLIALKAMRNSYVVVGLGFVCALVTLYMKMSPSIMLNIIFVSFIIGSLFEGFSQLYFYRKGSKMTKLVILNNIRKLRFYHNEMTQQELAKKTGVTRQTIIAIENGKYSPSLELAFRIANVFETKLEDVFSYEIVDDHKENDSK